MAGTFYKNADANTIAEVKTVALNWTPTVLEDGYDNLTAAEQIGVTNEVLEINVENRDAVTAYGCRTTYTAGNTATLMITMFLATTTATPMVLLCTGPLCVEFGSNEAWGELQMFRTRFRATAWTFYASTV